MTEVISGTSTIIEIPETKTTTTSTSKTGDTTTNNEVKNEKSNQGESTNSEDNEKVLLTKAKLSLVMLGYIILYLT